MEQKTASTQAWTEVIYQPDDQNPYVAVPLLGRTTRFRLCREGQPAEEMRQSFVVFRRQGSDEWEDDAPVGNIEAAAIGEGDEEVKPVRLVNLGMEPADFVAVERLAPSATVFRVDWPHGEVAVEGARKVEAGYEVRKSDLGGARPLLCTLSPADGSTPFTLELQLPFGGFSITGPDGRTVTGELRLSAAELPDYRYRFEGSDDDDRFAVSLDDLGQSYQYIWYEDGTLSVRDRRGKMTKVGEQPAEGSLSGLMMGSFNALVKHKDSRWRITVEKGAVPVGAVELDPVRLARSVFMRLQEDGADEDALAAELLGQEERHAFQWFWLKADDWGYSHLADLLDLDGIGNDQQKMMEQALRYDRYDRFMQRLRRASLAQESPAQADMAQMRSSQRTIARCLQRLQRHAAGEELMWQLDSTARHETLYYFRSFHNAFAAVS